MEKLVMDKRLESLEGIRILACISVFLSHFRLAFFPNTELWTDSTPLRLFTSSGDIAVRILFAISGILISCRYFKKGSYDVRQDMLKLYFRLAPTVLAAHLLVYVLMSCGLLFNAEAAALSGSQGFLAAFNNFAPSLSGCIKEALFTCYLTGESMYIGPLWIMVYGFLGSLLVLAIIGLCRGDRKLRFIIYLIILYVFNSYYNYFILGMIIGELYADGAMIRWFEARKFIALILFLISFIGISMMDIDDANKIMRMLFAVYLAVFFLSALGSPISEKILGNKLMLFGGSLAYPFYVLHWPVIISFSSWLYIKLLSAGLRLGPAVLADLILSGVAVALMALLFHVFIEDAGRGAIKYIDEHMEG